MAKVFLRPHFQKDLSALKTHHRQNYRKVCEVIVDLETGAQVALPRRSESRIPSCAKYELSEGYRVVFQEVAGTQTLVALCVGKHDHVDSFLDGHGGYVFDPSTGRVREIRIATVEETATETIPSQTAQPSAGIAEETISASRRTFEQFTTTMLEKLGVPSHIIPRIQEVDDPNSIGFMTLIEEIEAHSHNAADLLLAYATGNSVEQESVLGIARDELEFRRSLEAEHEPAMKLSPDEFVSFDDPAELQEILDRDTFEQWQLFLHPDQKPLVTRNFAGPGRIRGISGSGKTVVALHRARHLAKQQAGTANKVLFTTFNKALARAAGRLLDSLCGEERGSVEVTHLHKWCLDFIEFRGLPHPRFSPDEKRHAQDAALQRLAHGQFNTGIDIPAEYLWEEVEFIMGRFMHEERQRYLDTERAGRGRALSRVQRQYVLKLYEVYQEELKNAGIVDPAEFIRIAFRLRHRGEEPRNTYSTVIVDEVQDISEIGLRLLHSLVGDAPNGLFLVGDGTQRIFTRGYAMRGLGIEVTGRSLILRKNFRNTRQILQAAFPLVAKEWRSEVQADGTDGIDLESLNPVFSVREGSRPAIVRCKNPNNEAAFIKREVAYLLKYENYKPGDICVMARNAFYRGLIYNALAAAEIPVIHYQAESEAEAPESQVRISSLHSAKGHEYAAVLIAGMVEGVFPQSNITDTEEITRERAILYVGMTRARDIVYLSYSEFSENGPPMTRSRFLDEIFSECEFLAFNG